MSSNTGVRGTFGILERLRGVVRDCAAREDKLIRDHNARIAAEQQRREEGLTQLARTLAGQIAEAESAFEAVRMKVESRYARRRVRIGQAYASTKKRALEQIEAWESRRKFQLQKGMMESGRNREGGIALTDQRFTEFQATLTEQQQALALLEETAHHAFKSFPGFAAMLTPGREIPAPDVSRDEDQLMSSLRELLEHTRADLGRFERAILPAFFRYWPIWFSLMILLFPLVWFLGRLGVKSISYQDAGKVVGGLVAGGVVLHLIGRKVYSKRCAAIAEALEKARRIHHSCTEKSEARRIRELDRIEKEYQTGTDSLQRDWDSALTEAGSMKLACERDVERKKLLVLRNNDRFHGLRMERIGGDHAVVIERLKQESESLKKDFIDSSGVREAGLGAEYQEQWRLLEADWQGKVGPIFEAIRSDNARSDRLFPPWQPENWEKWVAPKNFEQAAKFGVMEVDVEKLAGKLPKDPRLSLPGPSRFPVSLALAYPDQGSILFDTKNTGGEKVIGALNNIILRLLSVAPPGRLNFTVIDPVGLGQNFSGVMHLADYAEHLINNRIWTQMSQIEQKLYDLNEHMEKVIQMYLRNEYKTIAEYNEQAGNIAEKYHFLVVADFPVNFSTTAAKRLLSIANSGARCGVYTLIHWDQRQPLPQDFVPEELRKSSVSICCEDNQYTFVGNYIDGTRLFLDPPPSTAFAIDFVHAVGKCSRDSNRVEVPFSHIAPPENALWSVETTSELRVPIGRTGATKLQYLAIGKGTRQHALIAGKTGSGKSTLFHVMISNLALWCSPEQVEFYLVDFKKGVEFKCYATKRLPHARVVAIESDRDFGLSVLQRLDQELKRRGDLFRSLGVQDVAGYKRAGGTEPMPRSLLMIDEFQEFFTEDDKISQGASVLLDRIVRQGRAFGIHVILGSQTLGGAYTMARTTLGQMVIRIALQCNEADAALIMDESNPAPRLLSRPGEGIYNDSAGAVEGNSPFQAVWLPDEVRDAYLTKVRDLADRSPTNYPGPFVFEGDAPADVRDNSVMRSVIDGVGPRLAGAARIWLGAPNSIKGPTEVVFEKQSGSNLLIIGQRDEAALAILSLGLLSLAAQYPPGGVKFVLFDGTAPGAPHREMLDQLIRAVPQPMTVAKSSDLTEIMSGLAAERKRRAEDESGAETVPIFLIINGLQRYARLRYEEDFGFSSGDAEAVIKPGAALNDIICEGASHGIHVIVTCDNYNNLNRSLSKKAISEFEMRVLFQMSANDSASLIETPKASTLGLHRALFYNEQKGYLEVFRPYALPTIEWIDAAGVSLSRLRAS